jgi:hypothetical protein
VPLLWHKIEGIVAFTALAKSVIAMMLVVVVDVVSQHDY